MLTCYWILQQGRRMRKTEDHNIEGVERGWRVATKEEGDIRLRADWIPWKDGHWLIPRLPDERVTRAFRSLLPPLDLFLLLLRLLGWQTAAGEKKVPFHRLDRSDGCGSWLEDCGLLDHCFLSLEYHLWGLRFFIIEWRTWIVIGYTEYLRHLKICYRRSRIW